MKKFKQFWASFGVAAFLSSFLMMVYELTASYTQIFPTEMGVIIPIILFLVLSVMYFLGNFLYIYLVKMFNKIHMYMGFASENYTNTYEQKEEIKYEEKVSVKTSEREV